MSVKCSVRHNVRETLLSKDLVKEDGGQLTLNATESELMSEAYRMGQELTRAYGTDDIPFMVSEGELVMNDDLLKSIDGVDPEIQDSLENELLASMRNVMNQLGLSATMVDKLRDREGNPIQGVAAADLLNRSIQYLEGKESELPEEVIHFYVQALKDTSDPLYSSMRDRIASEPEYEQVTRDYQDLGYTQEDIIDEAIAKVILNRVRGTIKSGVSDVSSEIQFEGPKLNPDNYEADSYTIKIEGKYAGTVSVDKKGYISSSTGMAGIELEPAFQNKGFAAQIYKQLNSTLLKQGKTLKSEAFGKESINSRALSVWKSLVTQGLVIEKEDHFEFLPVPAVESQDRNTRWWNRVLRRLKEMFNVGTESTDPFKQAALDMFRKDMTQYREVVSQFTRGQIMRSMGTPQTAVRDRVVNRHSSLKQLEMTLEEVKKAGLKTSDLL
jgi:hypothetical protein